MSKKTKENLALRMGAQLQQSRSVGAGGASLEQRLAASRPLPSQVEMTARSVSFDEILPRREPDLRPLDEEHVVGLAESFSLLGLLHFPIVDQDLHLMAGAHRVAALSLLRDASTMAEDELRARFAHGGDPSALDDAFLGRIRGAWGARFADGVTVNVVDTSKLDAVGDDAAVRFTIETVENEFRRNFSKAALADIVERLRSTGLYQEGAGRPVAGKRTLAQAVAQVTSTSRRTAFRLIEEASRGPREKPVLSPTLKRLGETLSENLSTKVQFVPGEGQAGKLVIHYVSHKQRIELLERLGLSDG